MVERRVPGDGAPNTNRTCDLPLRRGLLYPLSYRGAAARIISRVPLREPHGPAPIAAHANTRADRLRWMILLMKELLSRSGR